MERHLNKARTRKSVERRKLPRGAQRQDILYDLRALDGLFPRS